ncbi:uncharacterized protein ACJ7VT_012118 [Polymixia lowei]
MTIGSRKSSVRSSIRAPKFLDKASGFYGRLDEPETAGGREEERGREAEEGWRERAIASGQTPDATHSSGAEERGEAELFGFDEGMMEDDGETLLRRKPSRRSSRWRRSSRRKQKEAKPEGDVPQVMDTPVLAEVQMDRLKRMEGEEGKQGRGTESTLVHFAARDDADDQVLIRDKKRGREEEEEEEGAEEREMKREQEEGMKMVKRNTMKNYRKALDRAFRRGWEAFITNLYSVTLMPVTSSSSSSSSPSSKRKQQHSAALAEFK